MKLLRTAEKILPLVFWVFLIFAFDTPRFATLTVAAALIHEAGHLLFGISRGAIRLLPSPHPTGFRIKPDKLMSYKDELILLIGGPVLNFLAFFALGFLYKATGAAIAYDFAFLNLLTAITNLFPIRSYDGYRIIETALLIKTDSERALGFLHALSFFFTAVLLLLSLYFLLKIGEGYWIFAIFFYSLLVDLKKLCEDNVF